MPVVARGYDVVVLTSERFRKNDSLIFESDTYPLMTEELIRNIKFFFEFARIPNKYKVICVTYIL